MVRTYYGVYSSGAEEPWMLCNTDPRESPIIKPILRHFGNTMTVKTIRIELDVPWRNSKNETHDAILALFAPDQTIPAWEIQEKLPVSAGSVRETLSHMVKSGELVRVRHGVYRLP
jgi:hypothetical protein